MNATAEQFANANKANVEVMLTIVNTAFAGAERLTAFNLNAVRSLLDDSVSSTKELLAVKDVKQLASMQVTQIQPVIEKALAYSRGVFEIATRNQEELGKVIEGSLSSVNRDISVALDKVGKNAPAGFDVAIAAVKSTVAAVNSTYDSMTKAAKQVAELAVANVPSQATTASKSKKSA